MGSKIDKRLGRRSGWRASNQRSETHVPHLTSTVRCWPRCCPASAEWHHRCEVLHLQKVWTTQGGLLHVRPLLREDQGRRALQMVLSAQNDAQLRRWVQNKGKQRSHETADETKRSINQVMLSTLYYISRRRRLPAPEETRQQRQPQLRQLRLVAPPYSSRGTGFQGGIRSWPPPPRRTPSLLVEHRVSSRTCSEHRYAGTKWPQCTLDHDAWAVWAEPRRLSPDSVSAG